MGLITFKFCKLLSKEFTRLHFATIISLSSVFLSKARRSAEGHVYRRYCSTLYVESLVLFDVEPCREERHRRHRLEIRHRLRAVEPEGMEPPWCDCMWAYSSVYICFWMRAKCQEFSVCTSQRSAIQRYTSFRSMHLSTLALYLMLTYSSDCTHYQARAFSAFFVSICSFWCDVMDFVEHLNLNGYATHVRCDIPVHHLCKLKKMGKFKTLTGFCTNITMLNTFSTKVVLV